MELRTLIGPRAGEILDFCPQAAYAMLADGRAEIVSDDIFRPPASPVGNVSAVAPVAEAVPVVEPPAQKIDASASNARKPAASRRRGAK